MKKKIIILLLIFPLGILLSQNNQTNSTVQFQEILSRIGSEKIDKNIEIDGSFYFFKSPEDANIKLLDSDKVFRTKVNYNLKNELFEFKSGDDFYNLTSNKVESVVFLNNKFIVFNSKFYELISENDNFKILKSHFLETIEPKYQPGIEEKPNLRYRKSSILNLLANGNINQIKSNKKAVISLFKKSKHQEIKSYIKTNNISIRENNDIHKLFTFFKNDLMFQ
ncbi:MAG: hypothetical protein ISP56_03465 [Flavobacteriaceae bacterium]|nr:hypothetical protein [Flavobacteriaceae bacterium]